MFWYSTPRGSGISLIIWKTRPEPLLIAESILSAAVGALPGDAVAGHAPQILIHAILADAEAAAAPPAEHELLTTALALDRAFSALSSSTGIVGCIAHGVSG